MQAKEITIDLLSGNPFAALDNIEYWTGGIALSAITAGDHAGNALEILYPTDRFDELAARDVEGVTLNDCHALDR